MTKSVALQKCAEYDFDRVYAAVTAMMNLVPPPDVRGKVVLLKPNILLPKKPEAAVCTHPVVVGACVKAFVERGAKQVLVGESPAVANCTAAAKTTGIYAQVEQNGGTWIEFSGQTTVECPEAKMVKLFEFAEAFDKADVVVPLSKLKTHQFMSYTGSMKNLFGLMVGLKKAQTHYRFSNKKDFAVFLTDLNIAAKPQYAVMDAIVGMEGKGGPGNGDPVKLGFLAASDNTLALDWVCASAVGYDPHHIPNLEDALSRGIWLTSSDEITVCGATLNEVRAPSFKIVSTSSAAITLQKMIPEVVNKAAELVFVKSPRFNAKKCLHCGKCIEICPPKALSFPQSGNSEPAIDRKKCIHCYCCHEICPVEAITLRKLF